MKKKNKNFTEIDYGEAITTTIRRRYPDLILGVIIFSMGAYILSQYLPNGMRMNFTLPSFSKTIDRNSEKDTARENTPEKTVQKYTVQEGDTLSLIAQKFYGDLLSYQKIIDANKIVNPDNVEIGTVLIIP